MASQGKAQVTRALCSPNCASIECYPALCATLPGDVTRPRLFPVRLQEKGERGLKQRSISGHKPSPYAGEVEEATLYGGAIEHDPSESLLRPSA